MRAYPLTPDRARGEISGTDVEMARRQLLEYCKLDTLAMLRLHEALHTMASHQEIGAPATN